MWRVNVGCKLCICTVNNQPTIRVDEWFVLTLTRLPLHLVNWWNSDRESVNSFGKEFFKIKEGTEHAWKLTLGSQVKSWNVSCNVNMTLCTSCLFNIYIDMCFGFFFFSKMNAVGLLFYLILKSPHLELSAAAPLEFQAEWADVSSRCPHSYVHPGQVASDSCQSWVVRLCCSWKPVCGAHGGQCESEQSNHWHRFTTIK